MADTYSSWTGLIYIFNLIVGTGALTLPAAFFRSGWALGSGLMCVLAFVGYVTATFVVEAMATANALLNFSKAKQLKRIGHYLDLAEQASRDVSESEEEGWRSVSEESPLTLPGMINLRAVNTDKTGVPESSSSPPSTSVPKPEPTTPAPAASDPPSVKADPSTYTTFSNYFRKPKPLSATNMIFTKKLFSGSVQNFPSDPVTFYSLDHKFEMGEMAALVFNRWGRIAFFLCFVSYLFGDLSIYASAIGHSLVDALCKSNNFTEPDDKPCRPSLPYSTMDAYRSFLITFLLMFGPFVFFNVQKTKYIQFTTTLTRWLAFAVMIYLTLVRLLDPSLPHNAPRPAVVSGFPSLLSSCVYAFMCHHSLPSLLTPIENKDKLHRSLAADYFLVLLFYLTLSVPAVFAFPQINDLFTLNFVPQPGDPEELQIADYFLILFPVFTLTASFPVISVTLRNNFQAVMAPGRPKLLRYVITPLAAVIPPVLLAVFLPNLQILVGITGAYAGVGIQYVIPAGLVMASRRIIPRELGSMENPFASPFRHPAWPLLVILWAIICVSFSTVNIIEKHFAS